MKKSTKLSLTLASVLILVGLTLFITVMSIYGWDFRKLSTVKYVTSTYELHSKFQNISIDNCSADVLFAPASDGVCKVECYDSPKVQYSANILRDTLVIKSNYAFDLLDSIAIITESPKITVYLPENAYSALSIVGDTGDVEIPKAFSFSTMDIRLSTGDIVCYASAYESQKIRTSTGEIELYHIQTDAMALSVSTGQIKLTGVTCHGELSLHVSTGKSTLKDVLCVDFRSEGSTGSLTAEELRVTGNLSLTRSTGKISLKNSLAGKLSITTDTGDVTLDAFTAQEVNIQTDTGDVAANFTAPMSFHTETGTGKVSAPDTIGYPCHVKTDTGDISLSAPEECSK
ncbi:MAG: DUF4097 family beta strand repeat protein [Oscillospiraceae bacterium]|nr:DUF4097 family beta strand repeat protein [Oscillospiraceae bacterium]